MILALLQTAELLAEMATAPGTPGDGLVRVKVLTVCVLGAIGYVALRFLIGWAGR